MELKKHERGSQKAIAKQEEELNELFDAMHIDCMELQFGILKRMKFDDKITWIVEI